MNLDVGTLIKCDELSYAVVLEDIGIGASSSIYKVVFIQKKFGNYVDEIRYFKEVMPSQDFKYNQKFINDVPAELLDYINSNNYTINLIKDDNDEFICDVYVGLEILNSKVDYDDLYSCYDSSMNFYDMLKDDALRDYLVDIREIFKGSEDDKDENERLIYKAFFITYDDVISSADNFIKNSTIEFEKKLELVETLARTVYEFNEKSYIITDLKPSNFLFCSDKKHKKLKIFDFDSFVKLENINKISSNDIPCTNIYAPIEYYSERNRGVKSNIYSIGVILFQVIFGEYFYLYQEKNDYQYKIYIGLLDDAHGKIRFLDVFPSVFKKLEYEIGFKDELLEVFSKSLSKYSNGRTYNSSKEMAEDIENLIEIYKNKGVHPEVILNKAIEMAENIGFNDIQEELFTDIKEIND